MDYEEMSEPNMKLSRALLIVLVLHVVAVAGIIAFNAIKTRQGSSAATVAAEARTCKRSRQAPRWRNPEPTRRESTPKTKRSTRAPPKPIAKDEQKPTREAGGEQSGERIGKTYVVAKGDNPVTIAKKVQGLRTTICSRSITSMTRTNCRSDRNCSIPETEERRTKIERIEQIVTTLGNLSAVHADAN